HDARRRDDQAVLERIPDGSIRKKLAVPIECEMTRRKTANTLAVEGIKNEHDDGQINEGKNERGVSGEKGRATKRDAAAHWKDQRLSRRSVRKSREMVMIRMPTEMAAPSGQS